MDKDDYTLISSSEVSELKQDVDYLKKNPLGGTKAGRQLQESIEKLNESISDLIEIFKEAHDLMKAEEKESDVIANSIAPIEHKLDELVDQNQKIAKGILAVADMVAANQQVHPMQMQRPMPTPKPMAPMVMPKPMPRPTMEPPHIPATGGMPPPTMAPQPPNPTQLPPLKPLKKEEKKKGFLSFIKK